MLFTGILWILAVPDTVAYGLAVASFLIHWVVWWTLSGWFNDVQEKVAILKSAMPVARTATL